MKESQTIFVATTGIERELPRYTWRCCTCGEANKALSISCGVCQKQRWAQLGFSRGDAINLLQQFLPWGAVNRRELMTGIGGQQD